MADEPLDTPSRPSRAAQDEPFDTPARPSRATQDELAIRGVECHGHHGVFDFERRDGQPFVIDLVLGFDARAAGRSDDLRDTVDYGSLVASVRAAVEKDPVDLIETLAQRIADVCLLDGRVEWARVTVHKPEAPVDVTFSDVALTITRHQTREHARATTRTDTEREGQGD